MPKKQMWQTENYIYELIPSIFKARPQVKKKKNEWIKEKKNIPIEMEKKDTKRKFTKVNTYANKQKCFPSLIIKKYKWKQNNIFHLSDSIKLF